MKMSFRWGWVYVVSVAALGLTGAGCSSFEHDWEAMAQVPVVTDSLAGRWQGTWKSDVSEHTGGLRAIVSSVGENEYEARFHATFGCCFTFEYTVPLIARREGQTHKFEGEADIDWFLFSFGIYKYQGESSAQEFHSIYTAESDHGTFQMTRPAQVGS